MKINKKLIFSKTILFIFIVSFIIIFQKIFGVENTLIGVTIITAALMLLEEDLTIAPFKYFMYLIIINLLLGVFSFIASKNLWIGIPVNFIAMFTIGFLFCYDLKTNLYVPFGLQYLFMLSVPVANDQIAVRLISLVVGTIFIVLVQLVCNKHRLVKSANKTVENIFKELINKSQLLIDEKNCKNIDINIEKEINQIKKLIYSKRKDWFYLTEYGRINLNIAFILQSINLYMNDLYKDYNESDYEEILKDIQDKFIMLYKSRKDIKALNNIKKEIMECVNKENGKSNSSLQRVLVNLEILCNYFIQLNTLENHDYINKTYPIPHDFNIINILKRNFTTSSLRFAYAVRVALCTIIAIFIMDYFKIYEARWMAYTVFAIVQPYAENSKVKSYNRMKGTLIGGVIFVILFTIIKNPLIRSVIVIGAGYIDSYNTMYDRKMICVTISALGTAYITSSVGSVFLYRMLFVILGLVLALLVNEFILPYTLKDSSKDLINMGNCTTDKLIEEAKLYISEKNNNHVIENLFIISSLVEEKFNNLHSHIQSYEQALKDKKKVIANIYEMYIWAENDKILCSRFRENLNEIKYDKNQVMV
ncbi:FUSC family protein [Clostridium botulinum]|nr:FUSC family protein [Clostridium botulinum]